MARHRELRFTAAGTLSGGQSAGAGAGELWRAPLGALRNRAAMLKALQMGLSRGLLPFWSLRPQLVSPWCAREGAALQLSRPPAGSRARGELPGPFPRPACALQGERVPPQGRPALPAKEAGAHRDVPLRTFSDAVLGAAWPCRRSPGLWPPWLCLEPRRLPRTRLPGSPPMPEASGFGLDATESLLWPSVCAGARQPSVHSQGPDDTAGPLPPHSPAGPHSFLPPGARQGAWHRGGSKRRVS